MQALRQPGARVPQLQRRAALTSPSPQQPRSLRAPRTPCQAVETGALLAELQQEVVRLREENDALKQKLQAVGVLPDSGQGRAASGAGTAGAAGAAVSAPPRIAGHELAAQGPAAFLKQLERGVAWPQPNSEFWLQPPRTSAMPVDIGEGVVPVVPKDPRPLQVVHFTAEMAPIAKVGGLGDVVHGLARSCLARGHSVAVLLPFYECLPEDQIEGLKHELDFEVPKGKSWDGQIQMGSLMTSVWSGKIDGVPTWLVRPRDWGACNLFRGGRIYGGSYNEAEAYLYFCRAGLEYLRVSNQQPHVVHVHEWQTCAAAMLFWEVFFQQGLYRPRVVLTIHNMDNTGECRQEEFLATGVPGEQFATVERALDERTIGHNPERLNLMKGGLVYANAVTTVSPTYANEVLLGGASGWLATTLTRPDVKAKVRGILNGIDTLQWDPSRDPHLAANFNAQFVEGKQLCKRFLQEGLGLEVDPNKPLVAVITRLVPQKGIHLIRAALYRTLEKGGQYVLLGSGHCDGDFKELAAKNFNGHKDARLLVMYSEALAHQIYAAADVILVPSMFEPCGLTQMIGMRYGAVPVVRRTGGLADTVRDVDTYPPGEGNGYTFDGTDEGSLFSALDRALAAFQQRPADWALLRQCNLNMELSWSRSASDYVNLYSSISVQ